MKGWALNTGKLPRKCLLRKRVLRQTVVKYMTIWAVSQLFKNKKQNSLPVIHIMTVFSQGAVTGGKSNALIKSLIVSERKLHDLMLF